MKPTASRCPEYLWSKGVVPFLKVDKGLADEANGVKLMKPMPDLDALAGAGRREGHFRDEDAFGDRPRQPLQGLPHVVGQQFEVGKQVLRPRPRADHRAGSVHQERGARAADEILRDEILRHLDRLPEGTK